MVLFLWVFLKSLTDILILEWTHPNHSLLNCSVFIICCIELWSMFNLNSIEIHIYAHSYCTAVYVDRCVCWQMWMLLLFGNCSKYSKDFPSKEKTCKIVNHTTRSLVGIAETIVSQWQSTAVGHPWFPGWWLYCTFLLFFTLLKWKPWINSYVWLHIIILCAWIFMLLLFRFLAALSQDSWTNGRFQGV